MPIPQWLAAAGWGALAGSALLLGALLAYFLDLSQRLIAGIMALGSGVLISALAFDLMDEYQILLIMTDQPWAPCAGLPR